MTSAAAMIKGASALAATTLGVLVLLGTPGLAQAQGAPDQPGSASPPDPHARVVVVDTAVRAGPAASFRRRYRARQGEVFPVTGRSTRGFWLSVELPDGTTGWILGETVYVFDPAEEPGADLPSRGPFAVPPLIGARVELSATFGLLGTTFGIRGGGGFVALRPTIYLDERFGIELTAAASVASAGQLFLGTVGGLVNLFPRSPVIPYVVAGGGYALSDPNADVFLLDRGGLPVLYGGGGLRIGFRYRIVLRIEVRAYALFEADEHIPQEELSGGITVFF